MFCSLEGLVYTDASTDEAMASGGGGHEHRPSLTSSITGPSRPLLTASLPRNLMD